MDYHVDRRVIVVEGANYSGKSTLFRGIKSEFPGSMVIEFHDYYHTQLLRLRERGERLTMEQINSGDVPQHVMDHMTKYNFERIERAVEQVEHDNLDNFFFERLHGTDFVYKNLLFGKDDFGIYLPLEERLNDQGAALVVMTVEDDVMLERMKNTKRKKRLTGSDPYVPHHLMGMDTSRRKRDLYNRFYDISTIDRKLLVVSTNQTDNNEVIRKIKNLGESTRTC